MDRQRASEQQIAWLRRMGYDGPIDSKAHASALIDIYTRGHRVITAGGLMVEQVTRLARLSSP